ncbi:hypothetical protein P3X46_022597 [Hevea brasiliensis]|uniref:Uncharacterized protein n=2 Tax=Hevea brasiliensis TaxID=3981 RepID=A0ABQ9L895_HEVBR|nr:hypothetical protein P3X46_022597 [Hevea brasiliensis]
MMENNLTISESFALDGKETNETGQREGDHFSDGPSSQAKMNLGVTILASRFAANTRRGAQKIKDAEMPKLRKPDEPDFFADDE